MKQLVSITVILCLLFSMSAKLGLLADYYLNMRRITEEHCINKDKPEMHCNGSCYLSQQMKETENPGPAFPNLEYLKDLSPVIFCSQTRIIQPLLPEIMSGYPELYTPCTLERILASVFQPPEL